MAVEVLVMCPACGRPQPERPACAHCGAPMAGAVAASEPAPQGTTGAATPGPGREVDLGDGRTLRFEDGALVLVIAPGANPSPRVLGPARNVIGRDAPPRLELETVRRARLRTLRLWPLLAVIALCALLVAESESWPIRLIPAALVAAGVWMFLRVRYFVVRFERQKGQDAWLFLGAGGSGTERGVSAKSVWTDLANELKRRGVDARAG